MPATGGTLKKTLFVPTFNKGLLFAFKATSPETFQFFMDDFEILVGEWGRNDRYLNYPLLGGKRGDKATI